jgi:hypothetical protein
MNTNKKDDISENFFEEILEKEKRFYKILNKNNHMGHLKRGILLYSKLVKMDLNTHFSESGIELSDLDIRIKSPFTKQSIESKKSRKINYSESTFII